MFDYQEYTIHRDNKKNFPTYRSYLELYALLRENCDGETDGYLTDYCMANTSNLCEWFYENCELDDAIPMRLSNAEDYFSNSICLETSDSDDDTFDLGWFIEANPVFDIACQNLLSNTENRKDFVAALQNGEDFSPYAERLYREALKAASCSDEQSAYQYAEIMLCGYTEEHNRQLLVSAAKHFMTEEKTDPSFSFCRMKAVRHSQNPFEPLSLKNRKEILHGGYHALWRIFVLNRMSLLNGIGDICEIHFSAEPAQR